MMLRSFLLSAATLILGFGTCIPFESVSAATASVIRIQSLSEIADLQPEGTVYYFDVDDTLIDSPHMLGTKPWRKYIVSATGKDADFNWHDHLSLHVAKHHPVATVESMTTAYIRDLQAQGYFVYGLTARERDKWYKTPADGIDRLTILQLESVGLDFSLGSPVHAYSQPILNDTFYQGVYFSDLDSKGDYLARLYENVSPLPVKVIFVDDKLHNVVEVAEALEMMGIEHECYLYSAVVSKEALFDPLIANIQLHALCVSGGTRILSDEEASAVARSGTKTAEDYLQLVFSHFRP